MEKRVKIDKKKRQENNNCFVYFFVFGFILFYFTLSAWCSLCVGRFYFFSFILCVFMCFVAIIPIPISFPLFPFQIWHFDGTASVNTI